MKKISLVLLLGILLLVTSCGKKSTAPEEKPPEDYTLEALQTIGSEGGILSIDDFSLKVPAGAFSSDAELELYASSEDKPFGDCCMSRTFRLEGLPDEYSEPLQLSIKYQGTLSDSSFIAVGEEAMVAGSDELETAYQIFSATDSAGYLHCELPASEGGKAPPKAGGQHSLAGGGKSRKFTVASKYLKKYHLFTKYYEIWVPSGVSVSITELADLLDETYKTFMDMGFSIKYVPHVVAKNFYMKNFYCKFRYRNRDKYGYLDVNAENLTPEDLPEMRVMLGREVFRVIQFTYDPNYPVMVGPAQQDYYWLNEATLSWCEEKFVPEVERKTYVPIDFPNNEMAPFNGMQAGIHAGQGQSIVKAREHGWGMSSMIEFFTDRYYLPDSVLYFIHRELSWGKHPVEAALNCVQGELYNEWWHTFLAAYIETHVSQDIYNVSSEVFTQKENISGVFDIESDNDTLATFKGSYPDLSAKLYRINLKHKTIYKNAEIMAKAIYSDDIYRYVKIFAFKFARFKRLQIIAHDNVMVGIENVRELTDEGTDIIIMVVNSAAHPPHYTRNSDIDLEVRVKTGPGMDYNWCRIAFYTNMHFSVGDTADYWKETVVSWEGEGGFSGNTFTATWLNTEDPNDHSKISSGSMTVVVDPVRVDTFDVVSFSATKVSDRPEGGYPEEASISGSNIPFDEYDDFYNLFLRCLEQGTEACTRVGSFNYERYFPTYWEKVIGQPQCKSESEVRIVFWEWHGE